MDHPSSRRKVIKNMLAGSAALVAGGSALSSYSPHPKSENTLKLKGNINHSVCRWCYEKIPFEEFCQQVKGLGMGAIDLVAPKDWPLLQKYGLYSSMCYVDGDVSLTKGFADASNHSKLIAQYLEVFPLMVKAGYKDVICFSGSRAGMDDETGWSNCVKGLKEIMPAAEKQGLTVHMELLNSKVNHKDYMCDHTAWGVDVMKRVPRTELTRRDPSTCVWKSRPREPSGPAWTGHERDAAHTLGVDLARADGVHPHHARLPRRQGLPVRARTPQR